MSNFVAEGAKDEQSQAENVLSQGVEWPKEEEQQETKDVFSLGLAEGVERSQMLSDRREELKKDIESLQPWEFAKYTGTVGDEMRFAKQWDLRSY